jgi:hypothetical protein
MLASIELQRRRIAIALRLLHRFVSQPGLYDLSQRIASQESVSQHFRLRLLSALPGIIVLNSGEGKKHFASFGPQRWNFSI